MCYIISFCDILAVLHYGVVHVRGVRFLKISTLCLYQNIFNQGIFNPNGNLSLLNIWFRWMSIHKHTIWEFGSNYEFF